MGRLGCKYYSFSMSITGVRGHIPPVYVHEIGPWQRSRCTYTPANKHQRHISPVYVHEIGLWQRSSCTYTTANGHHLQHADTRMTNWCPDGVFNHARTPNWANPCPNYVNNSTRTPERPIRVRVSQHPPGIVWASARSKGGSTDISNCQMLCKTHNRAKGNR